MNFFIDSKNGISEFDKYLRRIVFSKLLGRNGQAGLSGSPIQGKER